ncbi:MAG: transglutaminase domain-containing protein [Deltaproteobacteria bacterium]|nr:transglutaminase domain-containing protein [Deltaproteobacteria bacterium]
MLTIFSDGKEVGREVRTRYTDEGPYGPERVVVSHAVTRMKVKDVALENHTVRMERTRASDGALLRASHLSTDQVVTRSELVGFDGERWDRRVQVTSLSEEDSTSAIAPVALAGNEVIGLGLIDTLRDAAAANALEPRAISYYEPLLEAPLELSVAAAGPGTVEVYGQSISGKWAEAVETRTGDVVARTFFDAQGMLWQEEYPTSRQVRRLTPTPASQADETSELLVGLHSEAYLANPNAATRARFRLTSTPDRLDGLGLLAQPSNQTVVRTAPDTLTLDVRAFAPDGRDPPVAEDTAPSRYVRPGAPQIREALRFLRSSGKSGFLPLARRDNATPVVARAALINNPARFWSDADQVAGLIMHYVSALIPDKRRTFSMADAVSTLARGSGDCTEHAVLFASLMRAERIPTRLVSGLYLTHGGIWAYHMWNEYWNGTAWQAIDASTMTYRPGALYVALGRGVANFDEIRNDIARFIWRTFNGVAFDLVEAVSDGEMLTLARPRTFEQNVQETILFNMVTLSDRGDYDRALVLLDEKVPAQSRSVSIKMMRIELLARTGRHAEALADIAALRNETSSPENTALLDSLELDSLLAAGRAAEADEVYRRMLEAKQYDTAGRARLTARFLFHKGEEPKALETLEAALQAAPDDPALLADLAEDVATGKAVPSRELLERAVSAAQRAVDEELGASARTLVVLTRVLARAGRVVEAARILDHAAILAPADPALLRLREELRPLSCP